MHTHGLLRWAIFLGATALVVCLCLLILSPFVDVTASEARLLRVRDVIHGTVYGVVVIALIQGPCAVVCSGSSGFLPPRIFFALLGGLQVFGVLGIVLEPVLFAVAAAIVACLSDRSALATSEIASTPPGGASTFE